MQVTKEYLEGARDWEVSGEWRCPYEEGSIDAINYGVGYRTAARADHDRQQEIAHQQAEHWQAECETDR